MVCCSESRMKKIAADVACRAHLFYASDEIKVISKKRLTIHVTSQMWTTNLRK